MYAFQRLLHRRRIRFWILLAAMALSLIAFEEVVDDVFHDPLEGDHESHDFDQAISGWIRGFRSPSMTQIMTDLTALGSVSVLSVFFFLLASVLLTYRDLKGLSYLSLVIAGAGFWPSFLKPYYARPRPVEIDQLVTVSNLSFPSGHSFGATAVYIALTYYAAQYARRWPQEIFFYSLGALLICLVGISRIYLGVHFPTDVLAGVSSGAAWAFFISAVYESIRLRSKSIALK